MKTALAILCSFLLAAAPVSLVAGTPTPAPCAKQTPACCRHGGTMPCCAAKPSPDSQSVPAVPTPSGQGLFSLLAPNVLNWMLPANLADSISSVSVPSLMAAGGPLYARHCALLL